LDWAVISMANAAIMAVVAIFDSHLLSKRFPSLWSFILPVGIIHLCLGTVFLTIYPLPQGIDATVLVIAYASGIIRAGAALLMLNIMRSGEISRIIPVVHTSPIFVAIFAIPFLGENLGVMEWLGILITVGGAILISVKRNSNGQGATLQKSFFILLLSSLLIGIANTASKYVLDYMSFWNIYSINSICFGVVFLFLSVRPRVFKEIKNLNQRNKSMVLLFFNESIAVVAIILFYWAMGQGPVSLVSTVVSTRPAFVFIFALIVSRFFPAVLEERLSKSVIIIKIISILLIVGGVTIITMAG